MIIGVMDSEDKSIYRLYHCFQTLDLNSDVLFTLVKAAEFRHKLKFFCFYTKIHLMFPRIRKTYNLPTRFLSGKVCELNLDL